MRSKVRKQQHGRRDDWTWTTEVPCCREKKKKKHVWGLSSEWKTVTIALDNLRSISQLFGGRSPPSLTLTDEQIQTTGVNTMIWPTLRYNHPPINDRKDYFSNAFIVVNSIYRCVCHTLSASSRVCSENGYFKLKHDLFPKPDQVFLWQNHNQSITKIMSQQRNWEIKATLSNSCWWCSVL